MKRQRSLEEIHRLLGPIMGEMSHALTVRKGSRAQMRLWAGILREAAEHIESLAGGGPNARST